VSSRIAERPLGAWLGGQRGLAAARASERGRRPSRGAARGAAPGAAIARAMDPLELEHVIGFGGDTRRVVALHPRDADVCLVGMGCNVVVQDLRDDHAQHFLQGHDEAVSALAVSRAGTFCASGQRGSRRHAVPEADVIVWDLSHRAEVYRLKGMRGSVVSLAFSDDEIFLAGAGADGSMMIWDMQTGEVVFGIPAGHGASSAMVVNTLVWGPPVAGVSSRRPNYVLYASVGHDVRSFLLSYSVGNMQYQMEQARFKLPAGMVREYTDGCLNPDRSAMLLCTSIGDVGVYRVDSLVYRASLPVCSGGARAICSAGPYVFVGGGDGTVKRLSGGGCEWRLDAELAVAGAVTSLCGWGDASASGGAAGGALRLLVGTDAGQISVVDGARMQVQRVVQSETSPLVAVSFRAGNSIRFATLNAAGLARVWDLSDYSVVAEGQSPRGDAGHALLYDDVEDEVLVGSASGALRAYRARRGPEGGARCWEVPRAHRDGVSAICSTRLFYATGGLAGGVRLWSRSSKAQLFEFADHVGKPVTGLVPDVKHAHLLHSCGADRLVFTYDLKKERRMAQHAWRGGHLTGLTQRLDSEQELITAGADGRLLSWDFDVPEPVAQVTANGHVQEQQSAAFTGVMVSPVSGRFVAACATDARLRVWSLSTGRLVACSPPNGFNEVTALSWSPDEKQIVTVGRDRCICVWNFYGDALPVLEEKAGEKRRI
jgi:WD40 repeat protein